jgi:hypothetical protein
MHFNSIFEELNKLYEEDARETVQGEVPVEQPEELTEAEETPVDEEAPKQLILECTKCGALVIKDEADVAVDEAADLANMEDTCAYCEEAEGYKIIGMVLPYEAAEDAVEEVAEDEFADEAVEEDPAAE